MITVYVSIGNSDDKLSQMAWSGYHHQVHKVLAQLADRMHGAWESASTAAWQNACWCIEVQHEFADQLKEHLRDLAVQYGQDSIAWAVASTEFIGADNTSAT